MKKRHHYNDSDILAQLIHCSFIMMESYSQTFLEKSIKLPKFCFMRPALRLDLQCAAHGGISWKALM